MEQNIINYIRPDDCIENKLQKLENRYNTLDNVLEIDRNDLLDN